MTTTEATDERWSDDVKTRGMTHVPNLLLDHQHELDMSSTELVVLLHVLRYAAESERLARPDIARIAQAMDLGAASVERSLLALQKLGLLRTTADGRFDSTPLVERLERLANAS